MAFATERIEKVTKTVEVDERVGVDLRLSQEEVDYLLTVLGHLPGKYDYSEAGEMNQGLYDALSDFRTEPHFSGRWRVSGNLKVEERT